MTLVVNIKYQYKLIIKVMKCENLKFYGNADYKDQTNILCY